MPRPKPLAHDEKGRPIWALNAKGKPVCGAKTGENSVCQRVVLCLNGRCSKHGGNAPGRPLIHGRKSAVVKNFIRTREEFLKALGGEKSDKIRPLIRALHKRALEGNQGATEYILNQIFGAPKSTIHYEIEDRVLFAKIVRVTARFIEEEEVFTRWLSEVQKEIETGSDQATSSASA